MAGSAAKRGAAAEAPATPAPKRATTLSRPLSSPPTARSATPSSTSSDSDASVAVRRHAFIAPAPARWRERYAPVCAACEDARRPCAHHPETPLRMLVIGHNPSEHSWASGWSYSNPSNNFWRLLVKGAIVPEDWSAEDCPRLPGELGVGFTDAGCVPGSDAARFGRATMREWRADLYARLRGHLCRASGYDFGDGDEDTEDAVPVPGDTVPVPGDDSAAVAAAAARGYGPAIVAFAGKRQYGQLFDAVPTSVRAGRQDSNSLPPGWPFCPESTEVWVLPSSSGRAAMTREAREGPYVELGRRLAESRWPRDDVHVGEGVGGERASRGDETNRRRGDDDASRCGG